MSCNVHLFPVHFFCFFYKIYNFFNIVIGIFYFLWALFSLPGLNY